MAVKTLPNQAQLDSMNASSTSVEVTHALSTEVTPLVRASEQASV
jgi:hypothetical protein